MLAASLAHVSERRIVIGYCVVDADNAALRIFFVVAGPDVNDGPPLRVVIYDAAGERYLPKGDVGGFGNTTSQMIHALFTLDPNMLAPKKAAYVGIEQIKRKAGV